MDKQTIYSKFKQTVEKYPHAPAVIEDERVITYSELDVMVDAIMAKFYQSAPAFVGIVMSHGVEQIAGMLAVLKSGAAYVPAERFLPQERIDYMMKTAGVQLIITDSYCRDLTPAPQLMPDRSTAPGVAYILYTSGTTGKPKGVVVENHSVVNYAEAFHDEFRTGPGDVMLQYSVCSFDIFVEEVFTTLLSGAAVCIPPSSVRNGSIQGLMRFVDKHRVTIIDGFPYLLAEMNKLPQIPESVKLLISGGDVIRETYISNLKNSGVKIYNTYGPSETTVCSNYYRVDNAVPLDDGTYPVGKAIKGVEVKILDRRLKEVPQGEVGEICIFGEGVSRGYLGTPPEQKNFVTFADGTRMYRSGDLGYMLPDGNLAFLHRRDEQVMILGKRVEPEEVENVLNTCPCVERGIVRAFLDENGLHYLVAYIVAGKDCTLHEIRKHLAAHLTDFMIPEFFVKMKKIPLTRRGKVDTEALPVVMKEGGRMNVELRPVKALPTLMAWRIEVLRCVFKQEPSKRLLVANRRYYRRHIADGSHIALIANVDGEDCGCGSVCFSEELPSPDNPTGRCAYLMNIYVRESFRNRGIAHRIIRALIEEARKHECEKIYLETTEEGRPVYETSGFKPLPGIMKYYDTKH